MVNQRINAARRAAWESRSAAADAANHTAELINQLEQHIAAVAEMRAALEKAVNFIANTESEIGITLECGAAARAALETANNLEPAQ